MAGKIIKNTLHKMATPQKKNDSGDKHPKASNFMHGLKSWITSPGGIITLILVVGLAFYVNHNYQHKKA